MKVWCVVALVVSAAFATVKGTESHREFPAFALNNFKDSILTWANIRDNPNDGPVRGPGFTGLHGGKTGADMEFNALTVDSFALFVDGKSYSDTKLFGGDAWIETDGIFYYEPYAYNNDSSVIGSALKLQRVVALPEGLHAYAVVYRLQNTNSGGSMKISLLDYVHSGEGEGSTSKCASDTMECSYTLPSSAGSWIVGSKISGGGVPDGAQVTYTASDPTDANSSPLGQFSAAQKLDGNMSYGPAKQVAFGIAVSDITVPAGQTVEVAFVHTFELPSKNVSFSKEPSMSSDELMKTCSQMTKAWLKRGLFQWDDFSTHMKRKTDDFYPIALLSMRMSQNPVVGTFVASFHANYEFKTWGRDAVFSAMIMDTAGYHDSAELFLSWLSTAERRDDGGFHTCYSWWSGAAVGFVEPQFDSAGAALMAYYYHYKKTGSTKFLESAKSQIRSLEDFFNQSYSGGAFVKPDYSIWEESSDGRTGQGIDPSHFTFTHSLAYAGVLSASFLEKEVFGDQSRADALASRAQALSDNLEAHFWREFANGTGLYVRGLMADSLEQDLRMDGSTAAAVFSGACKNVTRARMHLDSIKRRITKLNAGISRYENDPFFYDSLYNPGGREVGEAAPPWGVVTMFTAWAEISAYGCEGSAIIVRERLNWMVDHLYPHYMPVGESVDGVSGEPVMSSSPDLYEHAGVYIWTYLLYNNMAVLPNPIYW